MLGIYVLGMLVFLLAPVDYRGTVGLISGFFRDDLGLTVVRNGMVEAVGNVLLFIPVGLLLVLRLRRPWIGAVAALTISVGVEMVQVLIPSRVTSPRDVIANTLGAMIGASIAWTVLRRGRTPPQLPVTAEVEP